MERIVEASSKIVVMANKAYRELLRSIYRVPGRQDRGSFAHGIPRLSVCGGPTRQRPNSDFSDRSVISDLWPAFPPARASRS